MNCSAGHPAVTERDRGPKTGQKGGDGAPSWLECGRAVTGGIRPGRPKTHQDGAPVGAGTAGWLLTVPIAARSHQPGPAGGSKPASNPQISSVLFPRRL